MIYIKYFFCNTDNADFLRNSAHAARDELLFRAFCVKDANKSIRIAKSGKPYIENAGFDFSVSHTANVAVVAACGKGEKTEDCICIDKSAQKIGVDIECVDRPISSKSIAHIAEKFFSEKEHEYLKNGTDGEKRRFLEIWTKKESIVKATGEGLFGMKKADTFNFTGVLLDTRCVDFSGRTYIISVAAY